MSRITPILSAAAIALIVTACGNNPTSPSASLKNGGTTKSADSTTTAAQPKPAGIEEEITLVASTDFPGATGRAKFETGEGENEGEGDAPAASDGSDGSGGSEGAELEIRVQGISSLAGTKVTFLLGGVMIGTGTVSSDGEARLKLESEDGGTAPASVTGMKVEVKSATAVLIVSGTF
jgi:hypothetical protein